MYDERKKMNELDSIRLSVFIYMKQQGIFIIKFFHYNEQDSNINFIKGGKHRNNKSLSNKNHRISIIKCQ